MIPLMKSAFVREHDTKQALADFILRSSRLSMDVKCAEFEQAFAKFQGRRHAVLFNSGASANLALMQSLRNLERLPDGARVGFSALTWSTNVMPLIQMGMVPVPIDCEPSTMNAMSDNLRTRLTDGRLDAFFITNAIGYAGDLDQVRALCNAEGVLLLEDNCEALGTELPAGMTGNFGLAASFSFFVAHHMSTIEGGMLCTDDEELMEMLRIVRANGWDRNLSASQKHRWRKRFGVESEFDAKYTFYDLGFNLRPTEITGFLGLNQLQYLPETIATRQRTYFRLEEIQKANRDFVPLDHSHIKVLSAFAVPIICNTAELRASYMEQFAGAGVEIRPMIAGNMQRQPFYRKYVPGEYHLSGADFIHECGFYFGLHPELTEQDLETLGSCLQPY